MVNSAIHAPGNPTRPALQSKNLSRNLNSPLLCRVLGANFSDKS
jgi:hypothetical protein